MKIKDASTKVFLRELFLVEEQGRMTERKFMFDKLENVMSINKKLLKGAKAMEDRPDVIQFGSDPIEFTPEEVAIIVELFDSVKEWTFSKAEKALEVKALLKGK